MSHFLNPFIRPRLKRTVLRVPRTFVGVVSCRVVAADKSPPWLIALVDAGSMKDIAVKEKSVTGIQMAIDPFKMLFDYLHAFDCRAHLITETFVVKTSHEVRTFQYLKASVF